MIILWIRDIQIPIVGLSIISLTFYSIGAYMRLFSFDISEKTIPWGRGAVVMFIILTLIFPLYSSIYISRIVTLIGAISILFASDFIINTKPDLASKVTSLNREVFLFLRLIV